jgi:hypothetical protein
MATKPKPTKQYRYLVVDQWHSRGVTFLRDIMEPARHRGDAAAVNAICGFTPPQLQDTQPDCPYGSVVFRVARNGRLTKVATNYDSSG